ncbi:MAG: tRNA (guanosine(37)-N1)-methyltransferase TrmD [Acidobacteria bacterium]|jgi:tRNA (guanine37-N1)-methyltransferase|nr:MAG: tRNA (guanosine(37)-N1)-methyltransferase TrmD [Acidobacteriota bacterium]
MKFFVLTIFPHIITCYASYGIVSQAIKKGLLELHTIDLREFALKGQVDDLAYGGHPGMVLKPEPIFEAYDHVVKTYGKPHTLIPQPWGKRLTQEDLDRLSKRESIAIICGRYEGIDERVNVLADEELSLGDFVLAGGELFTLVLLEGIARLLPGVLSEPESLKRDSFRRWLGSPVYTRPAEYRGMKVPEILLSGNHRLIELWNLWHSIERSLRLRPDLVPKDLTDLERSMVDAIMRGKSFEDWIREVGHGKPKRGHKGL